jgi:hypothetical protein
MRTDIFEGTTIASFTPLHHTGSQHKNTLRVMQKVSFPGKSHPGSLLSYSYFKNIGRTRHGVE